MAYIHKREPIIFTKWFSIRVENWDDACISAIYEVIERHSITVNEMNNTDKQMEVDQDSIESEDLKI